MDSDLEENPLLMLPPTTVWVSITDSGILSYSVRPPNPGVVAMPVQLLPFQNFIETNPWDNFQDQDGLSYTGEAILIADMEEIPQEELRRRRSRSFGSRPNSEDQSNDTSYSDVEEVPLGPPPRYSISSTESETDNESNHTYSDVEVLPPEPERIYTISSTGSGTETESVHTEYSGMEEARSEPQSRRRSRSLSSGPRSDTRPMHTSFSDVENVQRESQSGRRFRSPSPSSGTETESSTSESDEEPPTISSTLTYSQKVEIMKIIDFKVNKCTFVRSNVRRNTVGTDPGMPSTSRQTWSPPLPPDSPPPDSPKCLARKPVIPVPPKSPPESPCHMQVDDASSPRTTHGFRPGQDNIDQHRATVQPPLPLGTPPPLSPVSATAVPTAPAPTTKDSAIIFPATKLPATTVPATTVPATTVPITTVPATAVRATSARPPPYTQSFSHRTGLIRPPPPPYTIGSRTSAPVLSPPLPPSTAERVRSLPRRNAIPVVIGPPPSYTPIPSRRLTSTPFLASPPPYSPLLSPNVSLPPCRMWIPCHALPSTSVLPPPPPPPPTSISNLPSTPVRFTRTRVPAQILPPASVHGPASFRRSMSSRTYASTPVYSPPFPYPPMPSQTYSASGIAPLLTPTIAAQSFRATPAHRVTILPPPPPPVPNPPSEPVARRPNRIMCKDYIRGYCNRNVCNYSHEVALDQLGGVYTFCRDFENNRCVRAVCKFVHATTAEREYFMQTAYLPDRARAHLPMFRRARPRFSPYQRRREGQLCVSH